jgi:hypothetical protein
VRAKAPLTVARKARLVTGRIGLLEVAILSIALPASSAGLHWLLGRSDFGAYGGGLWIPTACFALGYYYNQLYDSRLIGTPRENAAVIRALASAAFLLALVYLLRPSLRPLESFAASLGIVSTLTGSVALGVRHVLRDVTRAARLRHRVLVLGTNASALRIAHELCTKRNLVEENVRLVREGYSEDAGAPPLPFPIAGELADLDAIVDGRNPTGSGRRRSSSRSPNAGTACRCASSSAAGAAASASRTESTPTRI